MNPSESIYQALLWIERLPILPVLGGENGLVWVVVIILVGLSIFGWRHEKLRQAAPGLMTSLGILGTFCGIFLALYPLDFSPGKMNDSIEELLDGMKIAFVTSLLGLFFAITFRFLVSMVSGKLHTEIPPEQKEVLSRLDAIKQSISGEGDSSLVTQMQKLRDENRDGFKKLDGLAETIRDALVNNLEQLIKDLQEIIGRQLGDALLKLIENIEEALIKQFGKTFIEFNEATQALKKWQEDHRTQVERLTEAFDQVAQKISQISSDCEKIPATMSQLTEILAITDTHLNALNQSVEAFAGMQEKAEQAFPLIKEHLDKIGSDLSKSAQGFVGLEETIRNTFKNAEEEANRVARQHSENVQQIVSGMRETLEQEQRNATQQVSSVVGETMQRLETAVRRISEEYGQNMLSIARKCEEVIRSSERQP